MQKEETKEEPTEDPFRMTAEPPDMKYERTPKEAPFRMKVGQPIIKYERTPKGWTVEAGKNKTK